MATADPNEGGIPAEDGGKRDDEGSTRRQVLKGLAAAALTTATVGATAAFADQGSEESLENRIIMRACRDPEFRRRLLANPTAAVAEVLGREFPAGIEVRVVQEEANTVYLVLPPAEGGARLPAGAKPHPKPSSLRPPSSAAKDRDAASGPRPV